MEIIQYITYYLVAGTAFMGFLDITAWFSGISNTVTNSERIVTIILFPVAIIIFTATYIKTSRKRSNDE
jgi:hypothetical protein|tara:strand:- start:173 stop:379 length:207 start_codon:yes stop_codon:yes gene_type:complete